MDIFIISCIDWHIVFSGEKIKDKLYFDPMCLRCFLDFLIEILSRKLGR